MEEKHRVKNERKERMVIFKVEFQSGHRGHVDVAQATRRRVTGNFNVSRGWLFHGRSSEPNAAVKEERSVSPSPAPSIGAERWARAEEVSWKIIVQVQPTDVSEERRRKVIEFVQRFVTVRVGSQVVKFLEDLGLDLELVGKILGRCPEIFCTSIDNVLKKKIEFLVKMGIPTKLFPRIIQKYPDFLVCDINKTLRPRMEYLMRSGRLSKREVGVMVVKFPPILGYSIEEASRPKLEFLVKTMGLHISDVVQYPRFLSYSLEKRIKPRFWILKSQNLECNLKEMLAKNDDEFASDFILQTPVKAE